MKKTNKVEKKEWAILISLVALGFSLYTYYQLLPLNQANVIFSEDNIDISSDIQNKKDTITATIQNIGKSPASNVRFRIYGMPFIKSITSDLSKDSNNLIEYFNDKIVHELQPGANAKFGKIEFGHESSLGDDLVNKLTIILIYHLSYTDSLTGEVKNNFFLFHYNIGGKKVFSLINSDLRGLKERLLEGIRNYNNPDLVKFIENIDV